MAARPRAATKQHARSAPSSTPIQTRAQRSSDPATAYAISVATGRKAACRLVRQACARHLRDLEDGPRRGLIWQPVKAAYAVEFFSYLHHSKGEWGGQKVLLEPWQKFVIGLAFGWKRKDGTRRFRTIYLELPRKQGKSTLLAGVGLYALIADREPGAEIYAAATRKEQARIIFDEAKRMVRGSPGLRSRVGIFKLNLSIDATASKFEPLSSDDRTLDGLNPHAVLIDELHKHKSRGVLDVLDTALGSRRQPMLWIITTAGTDEPETVYAQENDYAIKVIEGTLTDDSAFAFITTIDKDDRWDDPKAWAKANPNLGVSVKLDDLKRQALKAKNSPAAQAEFKRLRLNVRTASVGQEIDMEVWGRNSLRPSGTHAGHYHAEMVEQLKGRRFFGGLDLSSKIDLSAFVKLFPPQEQGDRWRVLCRFWMPADTVEDKSDRDRVQYRRWIDEGWIEPTAGNVIDHGEIANAVAEDCRNHEAVSLAYDPWNATQFAVGLLGEGWPMAEFIQGIRSYTAPCKELESLLLAERIDHGDNPVLTWMASNLRTQRDKNENRMPTKLRSVGRIDGMSGLIMAIGRSMAEDTSLYGDGRGMLILGG
jgi:phage terminase large subunit-like protein